jgi:hypothetical protein
MKITNFNPVMLENAQLLTNGRNPFTEVYRLTDGRIFKYLKPPARADFFYQQGYAKHYNAFCNKLKQSEELADVKSLVLPSEVSTDERGYVKGYFMPLKREKNILQLLADCDDVQLLTNYFEDLCDAIDELHKVGIVVPDLITEENVLYDPVERKILFLDYDGMQVGNSKTNAISGKLCYKNNSVLRTSKYSNYGLYTEELDNMSLATGYLFQLTGINLSSIMLFQELANCDDISEEDEYNKKICEFFMSLGIDDKKIIDGFMSYFSSSKKNQPVKPLIKSLSSRYKFNSDRKKFEVA